MFAEKVRGDLLAAHAAELGQIAVGYYTTAGDVVFVEDAHGELLGKMRVQEGEDPAAVARQLLRAKTL
jgi:hypothetical protein